MSVIYTFIATKTTNERVIPIAPNIAQAEMNRRIALAFNDFAGGTVQVGNLAFRPIPNPPANHLLCDGSEVPKATFPELYALLGDSEGTPTDAANFVLPNYVAALTPAGTAPAQTVTGGTVEVEGQAVTQPTDAGQTGGTTGGNVGSGGRFDPVDYRYFSFF